MRLTKIWAPRDPCCLAWVRREQKSGIKRHQIRRARFLRIRLIFVAVMLRSKLVLVTILHGGIIV